MNSKKGTAGKLLLRDMLRTYFLWNEQEENVRVTQPDIFDAWIREYVDTIANVDTAVWEIFHRWAIINACIDGQFLVVRIREDGTLLLEEKASDSEDHDLCETS